MTKRALKDYLRDIASNDTVIEQAAGLLAGGFDEEDVRDALPIILDAALDFQLLLPAPWGSLAELADGPLFEALTGIIWGLLKKKIKAKAKAGLVQTIHATVPK